MSAAAIGNSPMSKMLPWLRANGLRVGLDLAVNFVTPVLVYSWAKPLWGETNALLASSVPPLLWGIGSFLKERKIDALSVIALAGITLSLLMFVGGGSPQLIALKEKLVTLLFAFAFIGSALIGKPLIYPLARASMARQSRDAAAAFEARRDEAPVRHTVMVMTWVWGLGLLADGLLSILLVYSVPMTLYLIVGPILGYITFGGLAGWTFLYRRHRTRKVATERA
jgi:hypothetical protein